MPHDGGGAWMGGSMWIFSLLFWGGIIIAVVFLLKWLLGQNQAGTSSPRESAMDILKKRYAAGEIDKETFEQLKKDIETD